MVSTLDFESSDPCSNLCFPSEHNFIRTHVRDSRCTCRCSICRQYGSMGLWIPRIAIKSRNILHFPSIINFTLNNPIHYPFLRFFFFGLRKQTNNALNHHTRFYIVQNHFIYPTCRVFVRKYSHFLLVYGVNGSLPSSP